MQRYVEITEKLPREFLLLQGTGCFHKACRFCHYWDDVSDDPYAVNAPVLARVTGKTGMLDVINSGSAHELDGRTLDELQRIVREKAIHTLWFEAHYAYRHRLAEIKELFPTARVKFRTGVESFDPAFRLAMNKGIEPDLAHAAAPETIRSFFEGCCLLVCVQGQRREQIERDARIAAELFEYFSVNVFCQNSREARLDTELLAWFEAELAPRLRELPHCEVLVENTDLGVG